MQSRSMRSLVAVALLAVSVAVHAAAGEGTVKTQEIAGRVVVRPSGQRVGPTTELAQNSLVDVSTGARITLAFGDVASGEGSAMTVVGPAQFALLQITDQGNRVRLLSGVISEMKVGSVAMEIQTPYAPSLVLQNSTASARVVPGDRVTFQARDGDYLKVYADDKVQDLAATWTYSLRQAQPTPTGPRKAAASRGTGAAAQIQRGSVLITYRPAADFAAQDMPGSLIRLTYNGSDFGIVEIGLDTVVFLGPGDYIEFDASGYVQNLSGGIAHIYHPIDDYSFYDESAEGAADASASTPRDR